jgi:hypothetical protein
MENISNAGNKLFWFQIKEGLIETTKQLKMGPVTEFDSFMSAGNDPFTRATELRQNDEMRRTLKSQLFRYMFD